MIKKIVLVLLFGLMGISNQYKAQETSIRIAPFKIILSGFGGTIEHQIRLKSSIVGTAYFFGVEGVTGLASSTCSGTFAELAFRKYTSKNKSGLRGFYLSPLAKVSNSDCDNFIGGATNDSRLSHKFYLGFDFGFQGISKGGFTFDIYVGLDGRSSTKRSVESFLRTGLAFGYTFGDKIDSNLE